MSGWQGQEASEEGVVHARLGYELGCQISCLFLQQAKGAVWQHDINPL